jgi:hypothetical protein
MAESNLIIPINDIENRIFTLRGAQVMIDRDLAEIYQVQTKALNQAVKRNMERFPKIFRFQVTNEEKEELVTNCDRFGNLKHSSINPYAFTEEGVAMLSTVLHSDVAVKVSIQVMQAFIQMRKFINTNVELFRRLDKVELKLLEADQKFDKVFQALESKDSIPKQGIFFDGMVFDAYCFVADLVRKAKQSIVLIDNYIDDSVLMILSKKKVNVTCTILTKSVSVQMKLDVEKFNKQYPTLKLKQFDRAHDRFLIIDNSEIYHLGASIKDLGKKWFAFSKLDKTSVKIIDNIIDLI